MKMVKSDGELFVEREWMEMIGLLNVESGLPKNYDNKIIEMVNRRLSDGNPNRNMKHYRQGREDERAIQNGELMQTFNCRYER